MILALGEALIDFTPARVGEEVAYVPRPGGSPLNVALGLGRLGVPVAFGGQVSDDLFGETVRRHLAGSGVSLRFLATAHAPSTLAFVRLEGGREPQYAFYGEGAADAILTPGQLPAELPPEVGALHFGSISLVREPGASALEAFMVAHAGRQVISLDPNVRPGLIPDRAAYLRRLEGWLRAANLVKVSGADLAWLYPDRPIAEVAADWLSRGPGLVVVTQGADGAAAFLPGATLTVPGEETRVVDTVGAGDAFTAGLLAALHEAGALEGGLRVDTSTLGAALEFATRVARLTCERAGADPPRREEVGLPFPPRPAP